MDRFSLLVRVVFIVPFLDITLPKVAVIKVAIKKTLNKKFKINTTRDKGSIKFIVFLFTPV